MSSIQIETASSNLVASVQTRGDWQDEFQKYGCVVIKNVITPERASYYRDKQIQWLKKFDLGFDENDESTWTADHLPVSFKGGYAVHVTHGYSAIS